MRLVLAAAAAILLAGCGAAARSSRSGLAAIGAGLRGPSGLRATLYATGLPTVSAFAFDARGRLWAAAAGLSTHGRDGVYLVRGGRATKVISGLESPLGLAWLHGTLYVASIGRVDAYSGLRGTRFRRHRRILDGPVRGGENNGLVVAPGGGRLLMGITATCDHCTPRSKWSGAIVSFRPDGTDLRLYARRIRAPVGLAYHRGTLLATMDQRDDLGGRTPGDWLARVRAGQDWRFPSCYGQCAGAPRPLAVLDKHAAVGGVAVWRGAALVAEWQTAKVARVALSGRATVTTFLAGLKNPLALAVAPDRSLLVGDWGTGRVYRVR
jgi:glucose/arabinose dehydrogenase